MKSPIPCGYRDHPERPHHHDEAGGSYVHRHPGCPWDCSLGSAYAPPGWKPGFSITEPGGMYVGSAEVTEMTGPKCWCGAASAGPVCRASVYHDALATGAPGRVRRLYVAGPMSGYEECNYPAFNDVALKLRTVGYAIVNPAENGGDDKHYVDLLREDLRLMLDCDGVALLGDWWESTGARNEVQVAGLLKMPVRPWLEWVHRAKTELGESNYFPRVQ